MNVDTIKSLATRPRVPFFLASLRERELAWYPERGVGFFPVDLMLPVYDAAYLAKYDGYAATELGRRLTDARVALVEKYTGGEVIDFGCASGAFVSARNGFGTDHGYLGGGPTFGYDVIPEAVERQQQRGWFRTFFDREHHAATFWDSLEHLRNPELALDRVERFAFVSLPIFDGLEHVLRSRHFRRDEHFWYFTRAGFESFAARCGFDVLEYSSMESQLGRDSIGTFALRRVRRT